MSDIASGDAIFSKSPVTGNWIVYWKGKFVGSISRGELKFNVNSNLDESVRGSIKEAAERMMLI
jgi:hypothetical protein